MARTPRAAREPLVLILPAPPRAQVQLPVQMPVHGSLGQVAYYEKHGPKTRRIERGGSSPSTPVGYANRVWAAQTTASQRTPQERVAYVYKLRIHFHNLITLYSSHPQGPQVARSAYGPLLEARAKLSSRGAASSSKNWLARRVPGTIARAIASHRAAPACALKSAEVSSARGVAPKAQRSRSSASGTYARDARVGEAGGGVCVPQNASTKSAGVVSIHVPGFMLLAGSATKSAVVVRVSVLGIVLLAGSVM
ncbi:hypothetical protein T484DRAFT_1949793 [Baffinella frigidus]|nr:hypothetical protein T484DRAFT_1949793 [Cryptophyta sp. CCMP2293]